MRLIFAIFAVYLNLHFVGAEMFEDPVAIMKCANGTLHLRTPAESKNYIRPILDSCKHSPKGKIPERVYWSCVLAHMSLARANKRPTMETMTEFFVRMFSKEVLDEVPTYEFGLVKCADDFVRNFDKAGYEKQKIVGKLLNCSITEMISKYGDAVFRSCSPSLLEVELRKSELSTLMTCNGSQLIGRERVHQLLNVTVDQNSNMTVVSYNDLAKDLGIVTSDGSPTLSKIRRFVQLLYPAAVLAAVPKFSAGITQCGQDYVRSHTRGNIVAAEIFIGCFKLQRDVYDVDLEDACRRLGKESSK